jgi:hypothetical protein
MFISEKYLSDSSNQSSTNNDEIPYLAVCKFCNRKFTIPQGTPEADVIKKGLIDNKEVLNVCEASDCQNSYNREVTAEAIASLDKLKIGNSIDADIIKKALAD